MSLWLVQCFLLTTHFIVNLSTRFMWLKKHQTHVVQSHTNIYTFPFIKLYERDLLHRVEVLEFWRSFSFRLEPLPQRIGFVLFTSLHLSKMDCSQNFSHNNYFNREVGSSTCCKRHQCTAKAPLGKVGNPANAPIGPSKELATCWGMYPASHP